MEKIVYEHRVERILVSAIGDLEHKLNQLSEEGWELVCVVEERHYFRRIKAKEILKD